MKYILVPVILSLVVTGTSSAAPDFTKDIQPILQEKCINCHAAPYKKGSRLRKPKGDYRLDTRENLIKAGESEKQAVIPGNAAKSYFYQLIILPEDDDDVMPSKGDLVTPAEQKLIKDWIDAGAPWANGVVLKRVEK